MSPGIYIAIPLMLLLVILQSTVSQFVPILGIAPQLLLLAVIAWGMLRDLREGLILAFFSGILVDLFSAGPIGATSLAMMAAVAVAVRIKRSFPDSRFLLPMLMGALSTIVFWLVYIGLLRILMPMMIRHFDFLSLNDLIQTANASSLLADIAQGYGLDAVKVRYISVTALVHALLILPFFWAFYALERFLQPRKVEI